MTTRPGPTPPPSETSPRRGWARLGLSTRVLSTLLAVATFGFILTGVVAVLIQRSATDERIQSSLAQEVAELRSLAGGTDPSTGQPFASVEALLTLSLNRNIPNPREGFIATVNGTVVIVDPGTSNLPLREIKPLLAAMGEVTPQSPARTGAATHDGRDLRYVVVPVTVANSDDLGVFAAVIDATAEYEVTDRSVRAHLWASLASLLLIAALGALAFHLVLRPLRRLSETAASVGVSDMSARVETDGPSDLTHLAESVNGMLDRLQASFDGQKAMLDDVGHELRTPLTVIRGHLELMDPTDPVEVDETRALVTDELDRMSRLLSDLVLIARTEAPDFLNLAPTDLDSCVASALQRATSLADRDWQLAATSAAEVSVDEQRLTQALLQLAANAVRFTNPGDVIEFGTQRTPSAIRLWVRDTGEGIPASEIGGVFDRFERGSSVRNRGESGHGSGLGLSIVAAIARAHGGAVSVTSTQGEGATFTLTLPRSSQISPPATDHQSEGLR